MSKKKETLHFTVEESITVTHHYITEVDAGLSKEEQQEAIADQHANDWIWQRQLRGPTDPGTPHKDTVTVQDGPPAVSYRVMGVYTDTDNLQPFSFVCHKVNTRREAVARAIDKVCGHQDEETLTVDPEKNLAEAAARGNVRLVSLQELEGTGQELLHTIDEFASITS